MIITRLAGGIGNQMFQYAMARASQRSPAERIVLDDRELRPLETDIENILQRPYALNVFPNLQATLIEPALSRLLSDRSFITRIRRRLFKARTETIRQKYIEEIAFGPRRRPHLWLLGNFQSKAYFSSIRTQLLQDFVFAPMDPANESLKTRILESPHAVSIHIRRGDYHSSSNKKIYDSVTLDYYRNALDQLTQSVPVDELEGFVFSDDMAWARTHFDAPGIRVHYLDGNDALGGWKDMNLMRCCRHHLIANSSFSWWGAWLSEREGKNFAPRHWFRPDTYPYDIQHITPRAWQVIEYPLQ